MLYSSAHTIAFKDCLYHAIVASNGARATGGGHG
jgi:hypothetical protein